VNIWNLFSLIIMFRDVTVVHELLSLADFLLFQNLVSILTVMEPHK